MNRILVVRLGAMGDIVHTLPAVATIRRAHPQARIAWLVEPRWRYLLEGNPHVDEVVTWDRRDWASGRAALRAMRRFEPDAAFDLQGLIKSALAARCSGAEVRYGFDSPRERAAALLYSHRVRTEALHAVDKGLDLAAGSGARDVDPAMPLPEGCAEGDLPGGPFLLASPLAGWASKQWPLCAYAELGRRCEAGLGMPLVLNGPPAARALLERIPGVRLHLSGIPGLIDATRRATLVLGVDSGPLHLAAAAGQRGVALFGPTDPARNGPRGGRFRVLRDPSARTSYRRRAEIEESMRLLTPVHVLAALKELL